MPFFLCTLQNTSNCKMLLNRPSRTRLLPLALATLALALAQADGGRRGGTKGGEQQFFNRTSLKEKTRAPSELSKAETEFARVFRVARALRSPRST